MSFRTLTAGLALATTALVSASTLAEALPVNTALGVQAAPAPVQTENVRLVCGFYGCRYRPGFYGYGFRRPFYGYGYGYRRFGWRGYGWRGGWRGGWHRGWRGGWHHGWRR